MFSVAMRRSLWVVMAAAVPAWAWFGPVNVTGDFAPAGGNFFPDMASDSQGNLHVVWCDDTWRIRHRIKFPNGVWTSVTEVSSDMAHTYWVRCTMDTSDNLHVAWHNGDSQSAMEVYYRTRAADGTWSPVVNVSNTATASIYPDIVVDGLGRVFIAWHEAIPDGGDNWEVVMAMYDSVAWQPYQVVGTSPQIDAYPVLAVDGSNTLYLAYTWDYKEIYYRSRSSGGTWTGPVNVSNNAGSSRDPHIAVSADGAPHVVWHDSTPGNWEYFYATKSGGTWQTPLNLSNSPDTIDCYGAVAVSGDGSVHAVWQDYQRVYYTRNAGSGFVPPVLLYTSSYATKHAVVYVDAGADAHIAWQNRPNGGEWDVLYMMKDYPDRTPPGALAGLTAKAGNRIVSLNWTNPLELDHLGTVVRFKADGFPTGPSDGTLLYNQPSGRGSVGNLAHTSLTNGVTYYYAVFVYDDSANYSPAAQVAATPAVRPDLDRDGDVDQTDFGRFQVCFSGHDLPQNDPACLPARLDSDDDVDQDDAAILLNCFSGANHYANPACAD